VRAAIAALGRIQHPGAQQPLLEALLWPDAALRAAVVNSLSERGGAEAIEHLRRVAAADAESQVFEAAIDALKHLGTPEAIAGLVSLTADATRREQAVAALAQTKEELLGEVARGLLPQQPVEVRSAVVEALGRTKSQRASELLRGAFDDADASVHRAAEEYLRSSFGRRPERF
jgi:HEAT repeat protein